jgi:hypothetical protein
MRRLSICLLLAATVAGAQERYLGSPNQIGLLPGETQRVQVLDPAGRNMGGVRWSVEPEEIASLTTDEAGYGVVQANAAGAATVTGSFGTRTVRIAVTVYPGTQMPPGSSKWVAPPLVEGAHVVNQLQSRPMDEHTPSLYVDEANGAVQYIRAMDGDGIQQWVWPSLSGGEHLRLRCGDNFGGAVLTTERDGQFYVTVLKQDGAERWRAATGPWWTYTYTAENTLYLVEDYPDVPALSAFDGDTGQRKLTIPFPTNLTQHVGYTSPPGGKAPCDPAASTTKAGHSSHGSLFADANGIAHVPVTTMTAMFDATGCTPGQPVDPSKAKLHVQTHIQLLSVAPSGDSTWETIRKLDQNVMGWESPTEWLFPWGSTIPDGHGGVLVPARGQIGSVLTGKTQAERGAIFRVHDGVVQEFQMPVLPPADSQSWNMLLGENGTGFFSGDKAVVAYDVSSGRVRWVWKYDEPIVMDAALADGGVMVSTGGKTPKMIHLDSKGKVADVVGVGADVTPVFR